MSEGLGSGTPDHPTDVDPIAFDDQTIFGLDPAVHWVHWNEQREQFPEIVKEIIAHWDDRGWLIKLLNRLGFKGDLYHNRSNPQGIFYAMPEDVPLAAVRFFLGGCRERLL